MGAKSLNWAGKIRRAGEIWKNEGLRTLWFRFLGETVYRRLLLYEKPLSDPLHDSGTGIPVTVALLTESDAGEYTAFRPMEDRAYVACEWLMETAVS